MTALVERSSGGTEIATRTHGAMVGQVLMTGRPEMAKALATAIAACHAVAKNATNTYHKYDYASADAIIEEGRHALASAGLALVPVEASLEGWEREGENRFELLRTFVLIHASGESIPLRVTWPVVPEKGRPLDKATAAADTLSLSYLLRDLLMMPRVDPSDDVNARNDTGKGEKKRPKMTGAQMRQWLEERDKKLAGAARWKAGDLLAEIHRQAKAANAPENMEQWSEELVHRAGTWVRAFETLHPVPAAPATNGHAPAHEKKTETPLAAPPAQREREPGEDDGDDDGPVIKNGVDLISWLGEEDGRLHREGRCYPGELTDLVRAEGAKAKLSPQMTDWTMEGIDLAKRLVMQFEQTHPPLTPYARETREKMKKAIQAAKTTWKGVLESYSLKPGTMPEHLDPETLQGILSDLAKPQSRHA